jgi:branched-chain amino acid transport system substrate-binding protein
MKRFGRTHGLAIAATCVVTLPLVGLGTVGGAAAAPSKSPITVGSMASLSNPVYSTPQNKYGMEAAISALNATGGIDGHPVKLDFCDTNYDANQELSCTRELINDHVSAMLNPAILADSSGREFKLASEDKVPMVGGEGLSPAELTTPGVFPLSSGLPGWVYGAVENLLANGDRKVSVLVDNNPGSEFFGSLAEAALKSAGVTPVSEVIADPSSDPTLSTAASKAIAGGTDGIVLAPSPVNVPKLVLGLKQAGYTGKVASITALFAPAITKAIGSAGNGILLTSQVAFTTDTSNPAIRSFLADMKKYQPSSPIDESTLFSWASVELFAKAMSGQSSYTAAHVLQVFNTLSRSLRIGVAAPYSVKGKKSPLAEFTRIFNPTVQDGTLQNGAVVANGKGFINPFIALKHE